LPDGRILVAAEDDKAISSVILDPNTQTWSTVDARVFDGHSSAMYQPGKIMKAGTATADSQGLPAAATTYVLDMTQPSPAWQSTPPMAFPRSYLNLTILPDGQVLATGGGTNSYSPLTADPTTGDPSCTSGWPKPSWQYGLQSVMGQGNDNVRDIPDVSLFASNGFYNAAWAVCRDKDCVLNNGQLSATTTIQGFGGTSTSAPAFAGILALVSQSVGSRLGQANNVLYPLAAQHPSVYHDLIAGTGDNSVPCTAGSPNCGANGFLTGYDTGLSYDLATGLGSVDITTLVKYWNTVTFDPTLSARTF